MKIASSDLSLGSTHAASARREQSESLFASSGPRRADNRRNPASPPAAILRLSDVARDAARARVNAMPVAPPASSVGGGTSEAEAIDAAAEAVANDPFLQLVKSMVEMLTGRPVRVFAASELSRQFEASDSAPASTAATTPGRAAGFGIEYDFHSVYEETEVTRFTAVGVIRTIDGKEISFQLDLTMSRHYREETNVSIRAGDAVRKDPLVLNFGGTAAQLSNQHFRFDLDNDGRAEELPLFTSGSGYLALDLNNNGRIDSGAELFGPATNSGFAELARHDDDGNGWIDENDPVFARLQIWTPTADGSGRLVGLKKSGVGALALAATATPFELRDRSNADLGGIRASGLWLGEDGHAGSMQEIDLTV
ncbi:MAG: VCBS repeat-containing protein [Gammaproteobacteria bacterium]|nr:VCBS repeat-containing protein [Gammaproteobacteria bacterium]MBU1647172.1 VCBS repeat-containing protein [Gammaproteobacteria bacterium]MBU1972684.1 VCBS repeat-containing protein [Gammaproteobacteria bacterium]